MSPQVKKSVHEEKNRKNIIKMSAGQNPNTKLNVFLIMAKTFSKFQKFLRDFIYHEPF